MFLVKALPADFSAKNHAELIGLQREFFRNLHKEKKKPKSPGCIRFYVVELELESSDELIDAGLAYLNQSGWQHAGGKWLKETILSDGGKHYAIAAAWGINQSER